MEAVFAGQPNFIFQRYVSDICVAVDWTGKSFVRRVKRAATVQHADMPAKQTVIDF